MYGLDYVFLFLFGEFFRMGGLDEVYIMSHENGKTR